MNKVGPFKTLKQSLYFTSNSTSLIILVPANRKSGVGKNHQINSKPTTYLFENFALDFVGPLPVTKDGNSYMLVAVKMFTRWPIAMASKTAEAKVVSAFLYKHIFCQFGLPTQILTDNGAHFDNEIIDGLLALVSVHHQYTAPYRPSTNGRNEQMNGNITRAQKKLSMDNPSDWDTHLDAVLYAYRTKVHSALKVSPYEFLYGIAPPSVKQDPIQQLGRALGMQRLVPLQDRNVQVDDFNAMEEEYPIREIVRKKYFSPAGTRVVRLRHNKFSKIDSNYKTEIFTVVASFKNGTCQLQDKVGRMLKRRVNVASLRTIRVRVA